MCIRDSCKIDCKPDDLLKLHDHCPKCSHKVICNADFVDINLYGSVYNYGTGRSVLCESSQQEENAIQIFISPEHIKRAVMAVSGEISIVHGSNTLCLSLIHI